MSSLADKSKRILRDDADPEVLETALTKLAWEYDDLYERLAADPLLSDEQRRELYARDRGDCAVKALSWACEKHGVPFERLRLACNGQVKFLMRMGRVIIIQETALTLGDAPDVAAYKLELADTNSMVRQLEFDFGNGDFRNSEWSGCILAVLLHTPAGPEFTREHRKLGGVTLALPDTAYSHWIQRLDLYQIAMFGRDGEAWQFGEEVAEAPVDQRDEVVVTPKRKNSKREIER